MCRYAATLVAIIALTLHASAFPKLPASEDRPRLDLNGDPLPERAIARLGTARFRHPGPMQTVAFSRDGKLVAAASALPSVVRIWHRKSGGLLDQWWFVDQAPPEELVFSLDGKRLYAGRFSDRERLWSVRDLKNKIGADLGPVGERSIPFQMLAADGRHGLFARGEKIHGWDLETDRQVESFTRPERQIADCAELAGVGWVAVCHDGTNYTATRLRDGKQLWSAEGSWDGVLPNQSVAFSSDARRVAVRLEAGQIKVFDTLTGKIVTPIKGVADAAVMAMRFSPDGATLAVSWKFTGTRLYDLLKGTERARLPYVEGSNARSIPFGDIRSLSFTPDSKTVAAVDPDRGQCIHFFDAENGLPSDVTPGHTTPIQRVAFSADGATVATVPTVGPAAGEPSLSVWNAHSGRRMWHSERGVVGVAFSPDGAILATPIRSETNRICLWDVRAGKVIRDLKLGEAPAGSVAFCGDGRLVGLAAGDLRIWNATDWSLARKQVNVPDIDHIIISPDDRKAIAAASELYACDLASATTKRPLISTCRSRCAFTISPDGRLVATADGSTVIRLWEVLTWHEAAAIEFREPVHGVAFSPAGHTLAVATSGGTMLHYLPTGAARATLVAGLSADTLVAFSANGQRLVTAGNRESTAIVWDVADLLTHPRIEPKKEIDVTPCWADLASADPKVGYTAVWRLVGVPEQAVPVLAKELGKGVPDAKKLSRLIADLDSARFVVREQAMRTLLDAGEAAVGALREARKGKISAEQAKRIDELLKKLDGPTPSPDRLRISRAVATLQLIQSQRAREALERLAHGPENATMTQEAKGALQRWER